MNSIQVIEPSGPSTCVYCWQGRDIRDIDAMLSPGPETIRIYTGFEPYARLVAASKPIQFSLSLEPHDELRQYD